MEIIPAIDISSGKCVRLYKGEKGTEKVYYENPIDALRFWMQIDGIKRLHFVDLDGAWGSSVNKTLLKEMIQIAKDKIKVQIGGGIRSADSAEELIRLGADRIIIGTLAIKNPEIIEKLAQKIGSNSIIVALDYKNGKISTHGWTQQTEISPFAFGKELTERGAGFILFSAIEADGAFTGPDFKNIKKMVATVDLPVYAAGGIRSEQDLNELRKIGVQGAIVGKAFYEGKLNPSIVINPKYK
ncbi:MAG: 1-(5-phosphoribosyl)-5-[(5-phosphoribosylamino)methylideneamino] imidazole-4-carboxamide isomerase [Promethearchaeota archaeon]|nr:MAG: 1-(5-phosphoribosyl)-5-[(5-phosphoribosylamino)methylideneamino] imidazole-4-carboxamide isomerase [Candidatus Lokiarchaeota archaeon]